MEKVWKKFGKFGNRVSKCLEILEIVLFQNFRKLQKNDVKLKLRKLQKNSFRLKNRLESSVKSSECRALTLTSAMIHNKTLTMACFVCPCLIRKQPFLITSYAFISRTTFHLFSPTFFCCFFVLKCFG
jgi:hypothetical protein